MEQSRQEAIEDADRRIQVYKDADELVSHEDFFPTGPGALDEEDYPVYKGGFKEGAGFGQRWADCHPLSSWVDVETALPASQEKTSAVLPEERISFICMDAANELIKRFKDRKGRLVLGDIYIAIETAFNRELSSVYYPGYPDKLREALVDIMQDDEASARIQNKAHEALASAPVTNDKKGKE